MRNKKNILLILLFLLAGCIVFFLAGLDEEANVRRLDLYFHDGGGYAIIPQSVEISGAEQDELYEKIAEALIKGPADKKYMPIMSKSVKLNYVHNEGGNLTVDFSKEYKDEDLMTTYAVIKTFSGLGEVKQVRITADGDDIKNSDGEALGFMRGDTINTVSENDSATGIRLYFANSSKDALAAEYRTVNITDTQPVEQYIVTELIKGPESKDNSRLLAPDTGVLSVETTDGTCYVNFKQDFIDKNTSSENTARLIIYSVVNSLTERDNVKNVQFLIDGKKTEKFGDMNISELFVRNDMMMEKPKVNEN